MKKETGYPDLLVRIFGQKLLNDVEQYCKPDNVEVNRMILARVKDISLHAASLLDKWAEQELFNERSPMKKTIGTTEIQVGKNLILYSEGVINSNGYGKHDAVEVYTIKGKRSSGVMTLHYGDRVFQREARDVLPHGTQRSQMSDVAIRTFNMNN